MPRSGRRAVAGFFAAAVAVVVSNAQAQVVELPPTEPVAADPRLRLSVGYEHRFDADIDGNGNGEFGVDAVRGGLGYSLPLTDALTWDNYASYRFADYDFSKADPWDDIHGATWASRLRLTVADDWTLYGGPLVMFEGESGSDFSDGLMGGGVLGFDWSASPTLRLGLGFGVVSQIEEDVRFLLIPTVNWKFADTWRLRTGILELGAGMGIGAELDWELSDRFAWAFGAQIQRKRMRLDDGSSNPDGVGQERSLPVYAKLVWQVADPLGLEIFGGIRFAGELRVENSRGTKLSERDFDPQGTLGLRAQLRF